MKIIPLTTKKRNDLIDITQQVNKTVADSGVKNGIAIVYIPHTTAGVTINENADPDVVHDILLTLSELFPKNRPGYRHNEGNSDAHVKSTLTGSSATVIIKDRQLILGTWQSIYFCEFDGPRDRKFIIEIQSTHNALTGFCD